MFMLYSVLDISVETRMHISFLSSGRLLNEAFPQGKIETIRRKDKEKMKNYKSVLVALIAGISAILCVAIAVNGFVTYKKSANSGGITATGSTKVDFTSDLIVWRGSFSAHGKTTKAAYEKIKKDSQIIKDYLLENGVTEEELIFYSVNISKDVSYEYNSEGNIIGEIDNGYNLQQNLSVTSKDVDKIDEISRDITKLIDSGVEFMSDSPEYYYTKLESLKLEMIEAATKNAKSRIDKMAENSDGKIGRLLNADLGVFQITAQNSDSEEYSYGGTFNTSAKEKTASVTVRLNYEVE